MEPLFAAVICGCNAGLFREALHEVYLPRIQRGNTYFAATVLGAAGPLLSVLVHFFEYGRWGSPVETGVEGERLTAEDQLFILMQAGLYLTATRGLQAPEAQICYQRVESLCHSLNRPLPVSALIAQWLYSLVTDKLSATMQVAKRVYALPQEQNDPVLMLGGYRTLASTLYFLGDFEHARQYATRAIEIWRSGEVQSQVEQVIAPPIACLYLRGMSEWHLGETASSKVTMVEAISLAKKLNDVHGLAASLAFACFVSQFERSPAEVDRLASEMIALSTRQNFALWLAAGAALGGWARSALGNPAEGIPRIEQGIREYRATGRMLPLPYYLGLKAEALYLAGRTPEALEAIKEAEAQAERSEERWWTAELHRLRGVFSRDFGCRGSPN
jgi:tetratricopeptide (TPR) repeat protein